jgi:hypothetical protein
LDYKYIIIFELGVELISLLIFSNWTHIWDAHNLMQFVLPNYDFSGICKILVMCLEISRMPTKIFEFTFKETQIRNTGTWGKNVDNIHMQTWHIIFYHPYNNKMLITNWFAHVDQSRQWVKAHWALILIVCSVRLSLHNSCTTRVVFSS